MIKVVGQETLTMYLNEMKALGNSMQVAAHIGRGSLPVIK